MCRLALTLLSSPLMLMPWVCSALSRLCARWDLLTLARFTRLPLLSFMAKWRRFRRTRTLLSILSHLMPLPSSMVSGLSRSIVTHTTCSAATVFSSIMRVSVAVRHSLHVRLLLPPPVLPRACRTSFISATLTHFATGVMQRTMLSACGLSFRLQSQRILLLLLAFSTVYVSSLSLPSIM